MEHSETLGELFGAMSKAQATIRKAARNQQNVHLKNQYADLESVLDVVRPVLEANGLTVIQHPVQGDGAAGVITVLGHSSGEWMRSSLMLPLGGRGVNPAQQIGSAVSYSRRYSLSSVFAVAVGDDTDGAGLDDDKPRHSEMWEDNRARICARLGEILNTNEAYEITAAFCEKQGWGRPSGWTKKGSYDGWLKALDKGGKHHDELCRFAADWFSAEKT